MIHKNFRINVCIRLIGITLAIGLMAYCTFTLENNLRAGYTLILVSILVLELFWYIDRTNKELKTALSSLLHDDFVSSFSHIRGGKSFESLYHTMNLIHQKFQDISTQKELKHRYLQNLVAHLEVGVLCYDKTGKIELANDAFKQLLRRPSLNQIEELELSFPDLLACIYTIKTGERQLQKITSDIAEKQLAICASEFKLQDRSFKLLSFQDIRGELDEKEISTQKQLLQILTHEIMNSVTPIASLSDSLLHLSQKEGNQTHQRISQGLTAIHHRSQGLVNFTQDFRLLSKIPEAKLEWCSLHEKLTHLETLFSSEFEEKGWKLTLEREIPEWKGFIDPHLIEQVLINLIKNAYEALEGREDGEVIIFLNRSLDNSSIVKVKDNGKGISADMKEKIFTPFFSTKKHSSGIGLNICRQIIKKHHGTIWVESEVGKGSTFIFIMGRT